MFDGMISASLSVLSGMALLFAQMPAGTNYKMQSYGVGSGGTANSTSSTYAMEGISGEVSSAQMNGTTYRLGSGLVPTQQSNVPAAPTLSNPNNFYNKLQLTIDNGANPTDAKFAIAISKDNFATTQYVQNDRTIGNSLGIEDYLTYADWGGASGFTISGLTAGTTYSAKVRAMHGKFTESGYSAAGSANTAEPSLTFDLDISNSDVETSPPYNLAFNDILPGSVINSPSKIWVDFETNGESGGNVYMYGVNSGLKSAAVSHTIAALTGDLAAQVQGFGAQSSSATQTSGGPFTVASPYDGTLDNVGITDTNIRKAYATSAPIVAGRSSLQLKAKAAQLTPSSNDYSEILTLIGSASF
ncbi:MAG TPA: hypothetical protein VK978_03040 [Candidatus Saccharimonadales bacterium]|nr:hypothetical protein [Candidatus Saccharimonadales bacterium]